LIAMVASATARIWLAPPLSSEVEKRALMPRRSPMSW
jgi:hypothetical protein